jgi:hypothetical protein
MRYGYLLGLALLAILPLDAFAYQIAADSAADSAYGPEAGGAWKGLNPTASENPPGNDNGGFGFQPWNFAGGFHDSTFSPYGNLNHFIDGVDFPASAFNNLGSPSFGLTNANQANFGYTSRATRVLIAPLAAGDTLTFTFDNPVLAPLKANDNTGFILRLNTGAGPKLGGSSTVYERFGFFATYGFNSNDWTVTDHIGATDTGINSTATTSGAVFQFTLQSVESYSFAVLPLAGGTPLYSRSGALASAGLGRIDTLEIDLFGNGSGNGLTGASGQPTGQREFFFNNLSVRRPFAPGDYNRDGIVDAGDYCVWRDTLGSTASLVADGNGDGTVNQADYTVWIAHFGQSGGSGSLTATAVPEPATLVMLLAGGWGILVRRHGTIPTTKPMPEETAARRRVGG